MARSIYCNISHFIFSISVIITGFVFLLYYLSIDQFSFKFNLNNNITNIAIVMPSTPKSRHIIQPGMINKHLISGVHYLSNCSKNNGEYFTTESFDDDINTIYNATSGNSNKYIFNFKIDIFNYQQMSCTGYLRLSNINFAIYLVCLLVIGFIETLITLIISLGLSYKSPYKNINVFICSLFFKIKYIIYLTIICLLLFSNIDMLRLNVQYLFVVVICLIDIIIFILQSSNKYDNNKLLHPVEKSMIRATIIGIIIVALVIWLVLISSRYYFVPLFRQPDRAYMINDLGDMQCVGIDIYNKICGFRYLDMLKLIMITPIITSTLISLQEIILFSLLY